MKIIRPDFWNKFQCIGGTCSDNCCIGWEICIDQNTLSDYRKVPGILGNRLKKSIMEQDGESFFRMHNGRCAFLNEENLCDLIIELGEDSLCDICREHPRFYEDFGVRQEAGLGLCCEEAVRLLLKNKEPLQFEEIITDEEADEESYDWFEELDAVRIEIIRILQTREESWKIRVKRMLYLTEMVQAEIDKENPEGIWEILEDIEHEQLDWNFHEDKKTGIVDKEFWKDKDKWINTYESLIDVFLEMEVMDPQWKIRLKKIRKQLGDLRERKEHYELFSEKFSYEMEHLVVYEIFRYFLKGMDDEDILSKSRMAVTAYLMIDLLHMDIWEKKGELTLWDRICNIKAYSKELEYCPENLEMLMDALWEMQFIK